VARLDSVRQKIAHAELQLKFLNSEIDRYMSSNPGEVVPNPDSNPDRPTFLYRQKEVIPARISFLVGDCLQNLRSAFDYLVWELVLAAGNVPDKPNMFPVCLTEKGFKEAKRGDRLKGIAAGAETLVKGLQPYTHTQPRAFAPDSFRPTGYRQHPFCAFSRNRHEYYSLSSTGPGAIRGDKGT
jgi:hypothetical protein